jgi:putative redox protein
MTEKEEELELKGYKETVPPAKGTLTWDKDLIFVGRTQRGYEIEFDAQMQWGCSPTEALFLSLAGCQAIDMVSFLRKMKVELTSFSIDITGHRNPTPPQYYKAMEFVVNISGKNITEKKVERAAALSREKYCSVLHTLRKDFRLDVKYNIKHED